ncbi:MAG: TetR family transcriptional regulator [Myxococcota bacterium]
MTRREQIVHATLELLATTPLEGVTTRRIAARVGLSQPALFRHFADRDAIVEAAVAWVRGELVAVGTTVLAGEGRPLDRAEALARALGEHATRWPGLPRLLFGDVARGEETGWGRALRSLQAAQRALVAGLVREAVAAEEAPADTDADRAGAVFVAGMQGVLVQWLLAGAGGVPDVGAFAEVWRAGVEAGRPRGGRAIAGEAEVLVDAAAVLATGADPLADVLAAAERVRPGGTLRVAAPFRPTPLVGLFRARGWAVEVVEGDAFVLVARRPA